MDKTVPCNNMYLAFIQPLYNACFYGPDVVFMCYEEQRHVQSCFLLHLNARYILITLRGNCLLLIRNCQCVRHKPEKANESVRKL